MKMRANTPVTLLIVGLSSLPALAIDCPGAPEQASKDSKVAVQAAVGRLGPIKAGEISTTVERTTRDLLGRLPSADKVYLEQMLFTAYCTALRDNKSINDTEKANLLRTYAREVRGTIVDATRKPKPSQPPPNTGEAKKTRDATPSFPVAKKIFINYDFSTNCALWVSWDNQEEEKWTDMSEPPRKGKGGFYLGYFQKTFYTKTPYIYALAIPGVAQPDMYERGARLRATNRLDEVRVPLTANDSGGAFTKTITCP